MGSPFGLILMIVVALALTFDLLRALHHFGMLWRRRHHDHLIPPAPRSARHAG